MSYNPFVFIKSYNHRLNEFSNILANRLTSSEIHSAWSSNLEFELEPIGWQAIWKVSRDVCENLKITFPCTTIVMVKQVNFLDHTCNVMITEVENENIQFPDMMNDVPLIELYPTKEQEESSILNLHGTANLIDCLRFFYHNLWMPWDLDFEEDNSWVESHLEARLHLHYCMVECTVPMEITNAVHQLMSESRKVQVQMEELQEQLALSDSDSPPADLLLTLTELHNQMSAFHKSYFIYEKPHLLKALIERNQEKEKTQQDDKDFVYLVLSTTSSEGLHKVANLTKQLQRESYKTIRLMPTLKEVLMKAKPGATIWLTQGQHPIHDLGALESGGSISGLEPEVELIEETKRCLIINLLRGDVALSALTFSMTSKGNMIKVKFANDHLVLAFNLEGHSKDASFCCKHSAAVKPVQQNQMARQGVQCKLTDVRLQGSCVTDGVYVFPRAHLIATNCTFVNCATALSCYPNSTVNLKNCTFTDNNIAIEIRGSCTFSMENCSILGSKCSTMKLLLPKPQLTNELVVDNFRDIINSIPFIKECGTILENNVSGVHFIPPTIGQEVHLNGHSNHETME